MIDQDKIFLEKEGDKWFKRNKDAIGNNLENDPPLKMIELLNLKPLSVLEVGATNGYRLAELSHKIGRGTYVAIEPSSDAIEDGKKRFPEIEFRRGLMYDLPLKKGEKFDLVIINFGFHWVERKHLLSSVSEIDRATANGGHLIVCDFLPDTPTRVKYHHLPDKEVYTYKQDYAKIFLSAGLYNLVDQFIFDHDEHTIIKKDVPSDRRGVCLCLKKNQEGFYVTKAY